MPFTSLVRTLRLICTNPGRESSASNSMPDQVRPIISPMRQPLLSANLIRGPIHSPSSRGISNPNSFSVNGSTSLAFGFFGPSCFQKGERSRTSSITVEILLSYRPSGIIRLRTIPTFGSVLPATVRCSPIVSSTSPSTVSPKIHLLRASWLGGISPGWLAMAS